MNDFPSCQKEVMIKFHVINALFNKGIKSVEVNGKISSGAKKNVTDAGGFATMGPFVPGEMIAIEIAQAGYDHVNKIITAQEDVDSMMIGLNPTVSAQIAKNRETIQNPFSRLLICD